MDIRQLLERAYEAALHSRDPSTQNGAVIISPLTGQILVEGCNNFPHGVKETPERWERPLKYFYVEHAERAAILESARIGLATNGLWMVCPWFACADCARAIALCGITKVIGYKRQFDASPERWLDSINEANKMLDDCGVVREYYSHNLDLDFQIRFNGKLWTP